MDKNKAEFLRQFQKDMLEVLTKDDGENFRRLYKTTSKKHKKDLERLSQHPKLKGLVPH